MLDEQHRQLVVVANPQNEVAELFHLLVVRPPAGSSSNSRRGLAASARAISTRFWIRTEGQQRVHLRGPAEADVVERWPGLRLPERPAARVRADEDVLEHRHRREQVDVLKRAGDPTLDDPIRRCAQQGLPVEASRPPSGSYRRVITLNAVVLPAPFGPIRPEICPDSTSNETPSRATMPPKRNVISRTDSKRRH